MVVEECKPGTLGIVMVGFSPVVREGLQAILTKDERIKVIGDAPDEHKAIQNIKLACDQGQAINVVLTDSRNNNIDGIRATRSIKHEFPEVAVLMLTDNPSDSYVIDAIHAGAEGYISLKDISPEMLLQSVHRAVEGDAQIDAQVLRAAVENLLRNGRKTPAELTTESAHLTEREVEVLRLMGNGDSNKTIAATLGITLDTTKKHVRNVIEKLQARSRTHAAIIAAKTGIVGSPINNTVPAIDSQSEQAGN